MIMWIVTGIFAVLSILFLMGKGGFLIAGYNTASESEKARYDEKRLCRVMGIGMSVITISLVIAALHDRIGGLVIIGGVFIAMAIIIIGTNLYCINKEVETSAHTDKKNKISKWTSLIIGAIICGLVLIFMVIGDVKVSLKEHSMTASAFLTGDTTVNFEDIESVTYRKDMEKGRRAMGAGTFTISAGRFENDEFGKYQLYAYARCDEYVVLDTKDGYVVLNDSSPEKTKELYNKIQNHIKAIQ